MCYHRRKAGVLESLAPQCTVHFHFADEPGVRSLALNCVLDFPVGSLVLRVSLAEARNFPAICRGKEGYFGSASYFLAIGDCWEHRKALDCFPVNSTSIWKTCVRCFCREVQCYCDYHQQSAQSCNPPAGSSVLSRCLKLLCCVSGQCPSWLDKPGHAGTSSAPLQVLLAPAMGMESCSQEPSSSWHADV